MYTLYTIIAIFLVVTILVCLFFRRQSLPCPVWLAWLVEMDNPFTSTNRAAIILERLDVQPGMVVLDAGCGPGRLTIPAARRVGAGGEVVAVDLQAGMLERTKRKAEMEGLRNIRLVHTPLGEGQLEQGKFDRALLVTVLGEIPDPEAAMKELFDALKPGGILSVTELIFDPHFQRRNTVTRLALKVGFREQAFCGNSVAYTLHLEKPDAPRVENPHPETHGQDAPATSPLTGVY